MIAPRVPSPGNLWSESPSSGAALPLASLTPYLTTDGYVVELAATDAIPTGAVQLAATDSGLGYLTLLASTGGLRLTQNPSGVVLIY